MQALTSREFLTRIMSKARKYQAQLEERKLLRQLVDGLAAGQQDSLRRFKDLLKVGTMIMLCRGMLGQGMRELLHHFPCCSSSYQQAL